MALSEVFPEPSTDLAEQPVLNSITRPSNILDPGFDLTLRPMRYPYFYEMYQDAIKNTWTVDEIDFSTDLTDLRSGKMDKAQKNNKKEE